MQPDVSILVPNHNHKHLLPRLLESIRAQQGVSAEVIIVDDCSDEPCDDVVEAYTSARLPVRVLYHTERLYTKNARIVGMRAAAGRYIAFADADDTILGTDILATHVRQIEEQRADILHFRTVITDMDGHFQRYYYVADPFATLLEGREIFTRYLTTDIHGTVVWNKIYSRDLCLSICDAAWPSKVRRYVEDIYFSSLFMMHARKYVSSDLVGHAYHYVSKDRTDTAERSVYTYEMRLELVPYLQQQGWPQEIVDKYAGFLEHYLSLCTGRLAIAIGKEEGLFIKDETIHSLLEQTDATSLIRALLIGNKMNAEKIVGATRLLRTGVPE